MALHHVRNWAVSILLFHYPFMWLLPHDPKELLTLQPSDHVPASRKNGRGQGRRHATLKTFPGSHMSLPLINHWSECGHIATLRWKRGWKAYSSIWVVKCQLKTGNFIAEGEGEIDSGATSESVLEDEYDKWIPQRTGMISVLLKEAGNLGLAVIFVKALLYLPLKILTLH